MRRLALLLLLATGRTSLAALPRVAIDAPLAPVSAPAFAAAPAPMFFSGAPQVLGASPVLSAAPAAASLALAPSLAAPAPAALAAAAPAAIAAAPPAGSAFAAPANAAAPVPDGPRAIDALRANAPLADGLVGAAPSDSPEASARALEGRFDGAAANPADTHQSVEASLAAAKERRAELEAGAARDRSWLGAISLFIAHHNVPAPRFTVLRARLIESEKDNLRESARVGAVIDVLDGLLGRMKAEPDRQAEFEEHARRLLEAASDAGVPTARTPDPAPEPEEDRWRRQIDFPELERMYADDRLHRPNHWADTAPGAAVPAAAADAPLLERLLGRVWIDDGGVPEHGAVLRRALSRALESPVARAMAERFVAENQSAIVRLEAFDGTRVHETDGQRILYGQRAATFWSGHEAVVTINSRYLDADEGFRDRDLPPTLAHELLGHALWYGRAAKAEVQPIFHRHQLNEMNAKLVGWLVDLELDHQLEDLSTWDYIADPDGYARDLQLRHPYYALLFSSDEMSRAAATLKKRLAAAVKRRTELAETLSNIRSWDAVIDKAVADGAPEFRYQALRASQREDKDNMLHRLSVADQVIETLRTHLGEMKKIPEVAAVFRRVAEHPAFFDALQRDVDANARRLLETVKALRLRRGSEPEDAVRRRRDHWKGQVTFDQLQGRHESGDEP